MADDLFYPPLTAADDAFHEASDHWWETETAWFSFSVPDRKISGWFYNQVLATQRVCNGGAWVWDDSPAGAIYEQQVSNVPLVDFEQLDLRDVELPTGCHITMLEPLQRYRVRYADAPGFEADLVFDGVMAPNSHPLGVAPFWRGRHFDQPMHVTGTITLQGEQIGVDCLAGRDRSWGPRPMGPDPRKPPAERKPRSTTRAPEGVGYPFAAASPDDAWLLYTRPTVVDGVPSDELATGYLLRGGEYAHLVSGRRRTWLDPQMKWIKRVEVEAVDDLGRELSASGELVARHGAEATASGTGLFRWEWDGLVGWGEDQTYAPAGVLEAVAEPRR
ncbi:MAG TPA: hypothetical protein VHA73_00705 [Acidimicrobiales bacterium]|nr:hypothetical protein [Acidimicrobiales bacterium]